MKFFLIWTSLAAIPFGLYAYQHTRPHFDQDIVAIYTGLARDELTKRGAKVKELKFLQEDDRHLIGSVRFEWNGEEITQVCTVTMDANSLTTQMSCK